MNSMFAKHIFAAASMLGGSFMVFSAVLYMNQQEKPPKEPPRETTVEFQVDKKPPKKRKKAERRQQQPQRQTRTSSAPKTPNLSSAISGVSVDVGGIGNFSMGGVSSDLIGKIDEKGPMTEGALDDPPKLKAKRGNQDYPKDARKKGIQGYVTLNIYVRGDGSVGGVKVLDAEPPGVFEDSAKDFVSQWEFVPGTYEGQAVDTWVKQRIRYKLQKS